MQDINSTDDVLAMLDGLLANRGDGWWDEFYRDRARPCPFFVEWPDENLVRWIQHGRLPVGRALELGCGNGRNAIYLARQGFDVHGVDFSPKAIAWATERVKTAGVIVDLQCVSVFDLKVAPASYDFVYDAGCFHHIAPHRRRTYVDRVFTALKPGGWFGLVCFRPEGGSNLTDVEVYEQRSLRGGLGYTEERLREIWSRGAGIAELRQMRKTEASEGRFGEDFLWTLLAQKDPAI